MKYITDYGASPEKTPGKNAVTLHDETVLNEKTLAERGKSAFLAENCARLTCRRVEYRADASERIRWKDWVITENVPDLKMIDCNI